MFRYLVMSLLFVPFLCGAKDLSDGEMAKLQERFIRAQKATKSLQADFEQVIKMPGMKEPVVSEGKFFYSAPDNIRVNFTKPAGDYLFLHDETLEMSRKGKQAVKPSTDRAAKALVALRNVLRGTPGSGEEKMHHTIRRDGDEYVVTLTPEVRSPQMPEKIENRLDAETLILRNMMISLPRGIFLEYKLFRPRKDAPIEPAVFNLKS